MNIDNDISNELKIQQFKRKIMSELSNETLEKSYSLGAIQRKRKIDNPLKLLWGLLIYANQNISIRLLSFIASTLELGSISDRAWSKKMLNAKDWLKYILQSICSKLNIFNDSKRKIKVVDSSTIIQTGKERNEVRVHTCYSLNKSGIEEVKITDKHVAEGFEHYTIEKGDIMMGDRGYGRAKAVEYVTSKDADILVRISPNQIRLFDKNNEKVNIYEILKNSKNNIFEEEYYVIENKRRIKVRVVFNAIPADKMEKVSKRMKKAIATHQTKNPKKETSEYSKWQILLTTINEEEYNTIEIIELYSARWQIELLFKRMKQNLEAHRIPKGSYQYAEVLVYLWMITWLLVEKDAILMEKVLIKKCINDISELSFWVLCKISYNKFKNIICGNIYQNINTDTITQNYKYILNNARVREPQLYQCKFSLLIA